MFRRYAKILPVLWFAGMITHLSIGQVSINNLATTYTEDFNSLPQNASSQEVAWADNSTLSNWYAENAESETLNIRFGGTRHTGGSSERGLYAYGDRNVSDMALGVITRDLSGDITYGVKYQNQSGQTINSVTVSYTGEQWRISNGQRPQVLGFSYLVSNSDPTIATPERTSGYVYVPELYFTAPKFDTTGLNLAGETGLPLDGNDNENRVQITFSFNLTLADGEYVLFRWYKENSPKIEFGLAIDDLSVDFSSTTLSTLSFQSNAPIYHYIAGPIDLRIPDDEDVETYDPPSTEESLVMNPEETTFRSMIQSVITTDFTQARTDAATIGYELVTFTDLTNSNKVHYVLRHNGNVDNPHHWGTYIFNASPSYTNQHLSVPHPVHDSFTSRQGGYLYQELDIAGIQIAGNYRCSSSVASGCHGTTSVCSGSTDFRESDAAHASEMPFHYASEEIANDNTSSHFVQLHGFSFVGGDPDMIVSNGTDQTPSGADRVVDFVNYVDNNSSFNAVGVHSDPYDDKLTGYTNTFGRFLNVHQSDICSSNQIANSTTDRFMHLEQRGELREIESNYDLVRDAIINFNSMALPLELISFDFRTIRGKHWLVWQAQHTDNVDRIEIEGSEDGLSFEKIGVEMATNTSKVVNYSFPIESIQHAYFRLKIIDFDGYTEYSKILFVPYFPLGTVQVYPSVVQETCQIKAPEGTYVSVFDPIGKLVSNHCMDDNQSTLDMTGLRPGIYLVDFTQGKRRKQFKVVKE
jgi:hypothetical protein